MSQEREDYADADYRPFRLNRGWIWLFLMLLLMAAFILAIGYFQPKHYQL